jgi:ATP-binding cassette subfamily C protein/ATP-binding cassette subfamily C protein EexD
LQDTAGVRTANPAFQPANNPARIALARCRTGFLAAAGTSCAINLLALTVSAYMLLVYDRVLTSHSVDTLLWLTVMAVAALFAMAALDVVRARLLVRIGTWVDRVLSPAAFARALDGAARGNVYRVEALRDVASLRTFLGGGVLALFDAPWVPLYLAVIYLLHPWLGHVALAGAVVLFLLALANHAATRALLARANADAARALRGAEAAARNAEVTDGMGMTAALARRWDRENHAVLSQQARASDRAGLITAAAKASRQALQVAILGTGAWLALNGRVSPGAMVAASIILSRALAPVEQAIGTWRHVVAAREAWGRLSTLFAQPESRPATMELPRPKGELSVEAATYTPHGAKQPVLRQVSFRVPAGQVLAVIGPSAAGKSTLARLLMGIHQPQSGHVRLDGADVFTWSRTQFGRHVGYLPQDVELFPGTVKDNIARMDDAADPAAVVAAAELAGVHEMILRLPNGYDTKIGEQGAPLSGGQRQRIGLARALYRNPALLVLDEPNASLDAAGEQALLEAVKTMKASGTTIVLITHRPALMAHVDLVAALNEGRLELFGERGKVLTHLRRAAVASGGSPIRSVTT